MRLKTLICICILVPMVYADFPLAAPPNQQGLANLLFNSNDPQVAFACFTDYIGKLNTTGIEYKQNYTNCLQEAKDSRVRVEKDMDDNRITIGKMSRDICAGWEWCNRKNSTLDVFMCHAKEGPNNAKNAYTISDRAEEYAKILSGQYREIDAKQDSCCKTAERRYAAAGSDLYHQLKVCLNGRRPRPPPFHRQIEAIDTKPSAAQEPVAV